MAKPKDGRAELFSKEYYEIERAIQKYIGEHGPAEETELAAVLNIIHISDVLKQMQKDGMIDIGPEVGWHLTD